MRVNKLLFAKANKKITFCSFAFFLMGFGSVFSQIHNGGVLHVGNDAILYLGNGSFTFGSGATTSTSKPAAYNSNVGKIVLGSAASFDTDGVGTKFVNGYVEYLGTSPFVYVTGDSNYAPFKTQDAAGAVTGAYYLSSPVAAYSGTLSSSVTAVSSSEYWIVKGANSKLTLSWRNSSGLSGYSPAEVTLVGYKAGQWEEIPSTIDAPLSVYGTASDLTTTGSITSSAAVDFSQYEAFTFGRKGETCPDLTLVAVTGSKVWTGTDWSPAGAPTLGDEVRLDAPYSGGSFGCNSLNFNGFDVTLTGNQTLEIVNGTSGTGKVIMSSEASLLQRNSAVSGPQIELTKTTRAIKRFDYVYWGVPVTENVFSQLASAVAIGQSTAGAFDFKYKYVSGNTSTSGGWQNLTATSPGQGFIMRVKQQAPFLDATTSNPINLKFTGTAINGEVPVPVAIVAGDNLSPRNNNLLANPYPSAIDAEKFLLENSALLDGVIYLWRANTTNTTGTATYAASDYIAYTKVGSTAIAGTTPSVGNFDGKIATGQGFKVRALNAGNVVFNNCMRVVGNNSQFFRNTVADKFKLFMQDENGIVNQVLIAYLPETTLGYDYMYDAQLLTVNNNKFYSILDTDQSINLAINAKPSFQVEDEVKLGFDRNVGNNATYTIGINDKEGIFANNQTPIYLYDTFLGVYHDFSNGAYTFTSNQVTDKSRFRVVYQNQTLGNDDVANYTVHSTLKNNVLQVRSSEMIKHVQVYDMTGKLLLNETLDANQLTYTAPFAMPQAVYVVKIFLDNGQVATNKLVQDN